MTDNKKLPERIQRKRTKGYRMPLNSKYVGRPTKWGNPCKVGDLLGEVPGWLVKKAGYWLESPEIAVCPETAKNLYRVWIEDKVVGSSEFNTYDLSELANFDYLACWCPLDQPCHVDVLLELLWKMNEFIFQRSLFDENTWHYISEAEVRRVFVRSPMGYSRLLAGHKVSSPLATGVVYRCTNPIVKEIWRK